MRRYFFLLFFCSFLQNCFCGTNITLLFDQSIEHFEGLKPDGRTPRLGNFFILKVIEYAKKEPTEKIMGKAYKTLADSFYSGDGIDCSKNLALYYYKKSAQHNYAPAFFNIAAIYKERHDKPQAKFWIKKYIKIPGADLKKEAWGFLKSLEVIN